MTSNKFIALFICIISFFIIGIYAEDFSIWQHSKDIILNTTSSGADIKDKNIEGIPVLIRLDASNFNFDEAKDNGSDIRFSTSDGNALAFKVESFDPINKVAEIWVMVSTVYANNSSQYIKMYWGKDKTSRIYKVEKKISNEKSSSASSTDYSSLFDSYKGLIGIWHLEGIKGLSDEVKKREFLILDKVIWEREIFDSFTFGEFAEEGRGK